MSTHSNEPKLCQSTTSNATILAPDLRLPRIMTDQETAPGQEPSTVASITDRILQDFRTGRKSYVESIRAIIVLLETLTQGKVLVEGPQPQLLWQIYQLRRRFDTWRGALPCCASNSGLQEGSGLAPEDFLSSTIEIYSGLTLPYVNDHPVLAVPERAASKDGSNQGRKRRRP